MKGRPGLGSTASSSSAASYTKTKWFDTSILPVHSSADHTVDGDCQVVHCLICNTRTSYGGMKRTSKRKNNARAAKNAKKDAEQQKKNKAPRRGKKKILAKKTLTPLQQFLSLDQC